MTTPPAPDLDELRRAARRAGFAWPDAELEEIRPAVAATLRLLAELDTLPLDAVEPDAAFRAV